jgi:hypothetical protein
MRCFSIGLFALVLVQPIAHPTIDADRAVPRFILQNGEWVCVDRNPRQLKRQDCLPRAKQPKIMSRPE